MSLPDFLGIGAPKSGTCWLDVNLRTHPQIWMLPVKELHYFSVKRKNPLCRGLISRYRTMAMRFQLHSRLSTYKCNWAYHNFLWDLHYFLGTYNDEWFASSFRPAPGQISGNIESLYDLQLSSEDIAHVHLLMPQLKIIYLLRNPIERTWSEIMMFLCRFQKIPFDAVTQGQCMQIYRRSAEGHSQYLKNFSRWNSFFPHSQIFIGYYEEISEHPEELLLRIFRFLGVNASSEHISKNVRQRVFGGIGFPIPLQFKIFLTHEYYPLLQGLHKKFGSYCTNWLKEADEFLASNHSIAE